MADFLVSARKYRPQVFSEMMGQEHVSNTLRNAIKSGKLAHAFLFCGPRGVGKTTAARILAKTINCETPTADFEACGTCHSCTSFAQNSSFNIYELDAASNNSVEDIRELVNQVRFPPQSGKFKIYIIDEVHMLSQAAFNAFLKTLEEPPAYCKFILATTEKHKILPTILSRCQVFDFRRISIETIVKHLREICVQENIPFDEDTLHIIAQKADGGMRDALSMLDRLVSFGGGKLAYSEVLENLNVLDYDYFFKVTDALLAENVSDLLTLFHQILQKGFEGDDFMIGLCEHFRNLLFCKSEATANILELSSTLKEKYLQQALVANGNFLINCLALGNECDVRYRMSKNKRLTVELALVKMCFVNRLSEVGFSTDKKKMVN
ncbi:MAG TPA: DNA polymerase III subunit gamma/tau [Chitinophagales bacterium]|nr:DNA polymerase III subunit gamma/tau [Chitinophagales bacterium]